MMKRASMTLKRCFAAQSHVHLALNRATLWVVIAVLAAAGGLSAVYPAENDRLLFTNAAVRSETEGTPAENEDAFCGVGQPVPAEWDIRTGGDNIVSFKVKIGGFAARETPEGFVLTIPGQAGSVRPGMPDLPPLTRLLPGLPGHSTKIELKSATWIELSGIRVAPVERRVLEDVTTNEPTYRMSRTPSATVYSADEYWPSAVARVDEAWMGTQKIVRLESFMIQCNPKRETIRYTLELEGRLVPVSDGTGQSEGAPEKPQ